MHGTLPKPKIAAPETAVKPVRAAVWLLLVLGIVALGWPLVAEAHATKLMVLGGILTILGLSGLVWLARRSRTLLSAQHGFVALHGDAALPMAFSNESGLVLAANAAMDPESRGIGGFVADLLDGPRGEMQAACYRIAREAAATGFATETLDPAAGGHRIAAQSAGRAGLVWTLHRASEPVPPGPLTADTLSLIEALPVALTRLATNGSIVFANAAARALLGSRAVPGVGIGTLVEGLGRSMDTRIAEALRGDASGRPEIARAEPDGREVFLQVSITRIALDGENALVAVLADATELKTLEAQFVQSQKMQAVGQLAGGVAHDFNNLLTAISGHTDLLLHRHEVGDADYADLTQIRQNANRAASLVRQLLAFSRKQTLRPRVVSLADVLGEISHLLNRLLGERVTLRMETAGDLHPVKLDERQFEQVIMNLVVNARDAMADGGTVVIKAANCRVMAETRRGRAVMPRGDYVRIDVIDTGAGIAPEALDKIFEPFFTTKKTGEGTGLGLSTVYGIVKQTGGFIFADSEPGAGSTFSIYLPRHVPTKADIAPAPRPPEPPQDHTGRGVVMLVEDEAPVRAFAARALKMRGYEVLEAASAEEALDLLEDPSLAVDVLVSDVVMPGMDGPTCVRKARERRPNIKVVFVSGYAEDALQRSMAGLENCVFLPKPFSLSDLTARVKECVTAA